MALKELLDRARKAASALAARAGKLVRRDTLSDSGSGLPPAEADGAGEDGIADLLADSRAETSGASGFPGFAPPPSPGDRIRGTAEYLVELVRGKPRAILAAGGVLLGLSIFLLAVALALRPPKPMLPSVSASPAAVDLLRRIPVPRKDPRAEESALDRPRKDRYTEEDIDRMWLDLGLLPTEGLRERNRAELGNLLSAMERP